MARVITAIRSLALVMLAAGVSVGAVWSAGQPPPPERVSRGDRSLHLSDSPVPAATPTSDDGSADRRGRRSGSGRPADDESSGSPVSSAATATAVASRETGDDKGGLRADQGKGSGQGKDSGQGKNSDERSGTGRGKGRGSDDDSGGHGGKGRGRGGDD